MFKKLIQTILLVEDNDDDAELLEFCLEPLKQAGLSIVHCETAAAARSRLLLGDVGVILLDLSLPDSTGIETVRNLREAAPHVPVIVLTGTADEDIAIQALSFGAQDYLIKGNADLPTICRSINYAMARQSAVESSARLAAIVESSADAIIGKTISGTITSWNRGAEKLFGYSAEEVAGKSVGIIFPPDLFDELHSTLEALKRGDVVRQETVRVSKEGKRVDVYQTISPIETNGSFTSAAEINKDITEIKRSQRELKDTEHRLALALKAAEVGVWDLDLVNNTVWRSLRHDEIFGHDTLQPLWNFDIFIEYVLPEDRALATEVFLSGVRDGQFKMECRIVRASDQAIRWISAQGETSRDVNGKPVRMMGAIVDITERKEREEQNRLVTIMQEREDFMATLTHDMKNPLIGANRLLEMLIEGQVGELGNEPRELLKCLFESNTGVLKLIANLMDVYRLEKDVNTFVLTKGNLSTTMESIVARVKPFASLKGVIISQQIQKDVMVNVDFEAIERVIQNLLDNAIKFAPKNGVIAANVLTKDNQVVIEIEDNGPGIAEEELSLLFKRFSQGRAGKRYTGGTGLGLYLCRQIVSAHGGKIECRSEQNSATVFSIVLPGLVI